MAKKPRPEHSNLGDPRDLARLGLVTRPEPGFTPAPTTPTAGTIRPGSDLTTTTGSTGTRPEAATGGPVDLVASDLAARLCEPSQAKTGEECVDEILDMLLDATNERDLDSTTRVFTKLNE
jgi:hypothetical protein